jgi:ketosteroid isomerase-like protein
MSQENVALTHELLDAVSRVDLARLLELADAEIEWHSFFALNEDGYHGHDGMHQYVDDLRDAFEDIHPQLTGVLDVGDVVIAVGSVHVRGRTSGVETDSAAGWMLKFRDRKIVTFRAFGEPETRLETVGLS